MASSLPAHPITTCTVSICLARHHKFFGSHGLYIVWKGVQCVALHPFSAGRAGRLRRPQVVVQVCVLRALARTQNTHLYKRTVCGCAAALAPTGHPASCLSPKLRMMPIFTALAPTYSDALFVKLMRIRADKSGLEMRYATFGYALLVANANRRCARSLELAVQEARSLGHHYLGTEHLLLGVLREEGGLASQVLLQAGVTLETAREVVKEVLAEEQKAGGPEPGQDGES